MNRGARANGFTLLEVLVVVAILGLLFVVLTDGVRFAGRAWEVEQRQSDRQGDLDAVQNVLRQMIGGARAIEGDATSLRFVAPLPAALERGGLYDVELKTSLGNLLLVWKPHAQGQTGLSSVENVLARNIAAFELGYYLTATGWQSRPPGKDSPPALVRIALATADGRRWPPFVVAPSIELRAIATN